MDKKYSAPTIRDVAREAGVSLGTVSKVINDLPVGESYRLKVEAAASRLGYQVNAYARSMRTHKTNIVALILPNLNNSFFAMLAHQVCKALSEREYRMLVYMTDFDGNTEQNCVNMVRQHRVDGIIALTYNPDLELDENIPFVSIDRYFKSTIPCISADNYGGGQLAAEKLVSLGCKRLVFFGIGFRVAGSADSRWDDFASYCRSANIPYDSIRLKDGDNTELFKEYLKNHMTGGKPDFDGAFCATDRVAAEIQAFMEETGIRVPEDVQIIGFDGVRSFGDGELICSTIVQPLQQMAVACVDILLAEDRSSAPARICLPVAYVPGGTTREPVKRK